MKITNLKPEPQQKTLWLLGWSITALLGLLLWMIIFFLSKEPVFIILLAVWIIINLSFPLWIPAYHKSLQYEIAENAIRCKKGVFWQRNITVPYAKITNVDITQGPVQRMFNLGTIHIQTAGAGGQQGGQAELILYGIKELDKVKNLIMERADGKKPEQPTNIAKDSEINENSDIFQLILKELKAIRKSLANK